MSELPNPIANYWNLVKNRRSPYYDWLQHIIKNAESFKEEYPDQTFYLINTRELVKKIEKENPDEKLSTVNLSRTILAILQGSKELKEGKDKDYYDTATSGGKRNYHIKISTVIPIFKTF